MAVYMDSILGAILWCQLAVQDTNGSSVTTVFPFLDATILK